METALVALLAATIAFPGCDALLNVENPGSILEQDLETDTAIDPLLTGFKAELFAGNFNSLPMIVLTQALLAGETYNADTFTYFQALVTRDVQCSDGSLDGLYASLSIALFLGADLARRMKRVLPPPAAGGTAADSAAKDIRLAETLCVLGSGYLVAAETWWEMPFAKFDGVQYVPGPMEQQTAILNRAVDSFTEAQAVAEAAASPELESYARSGLARAYLLLGDLAAALPHAAASATGRWNYMAPYSNLDENFIYVWITQRGGQTVAPEFRNTGDPRVAVTNSGQLALNQSDALWVPDKYDARDRPLRIASWQESALIAAEAELTVNGDVTAALGWINSVRVEAGLAAATGATIAEVTTILRRERKYEFFFEGRRLSDLIRYGVTEVNYTGGQVPGVQPLPYYLPIPDDESDNNDHVSCNEARWP
ncbi:MAG: RagB/SusD family nutrient uptake outer membrane protein [Candidatus Marinimicrobia bacterium]|nr:RagB/SusD family nutrient uptake outer membrane protein [Candidatus Neomarinimicrobiota bacterium]